MSASGADPNAATDVKAIPLPSVMVNGDGAVPGVCLLSDLCVIGE